VVGLHEGGDFLDKRIPLGGRKIAFGDVAGVENGFGGEQLEERIKAFSSGVAGRACWRGGQS